MKNRLLQTPTNCKQTLRATTCSRLVTSEQTIPSDDNSEKITAIYCRTASATQDQDVFTASQRERLADFSIKHGYSNVQYYEDIGYSGRSFSERPAFQRMQYDINEGKVQNIIVANISRIGRNTVETSNWIAGLRDKSVGLIVLDSPEPPCEIMHNCIDSMINLYKAT